MKGRGNDLWTIQDRFVKIDKLGRFLIPKKIRTDMDIIDEALLRINYDSNEKQYIFKKPTIIALNAVLQTGLYHSDKKESMFRLLGQNNRGKKRK